MDKQKPETKRGGGEKKFLDVNEKIFRIIEVIE